MSSLKMLQQSPVSVEAPMITDQCLASIAKTVPHMSMRVNASNLPRPSDHVWVVPPHLLKLLGDFFRVHLSLDLRFDSRLSLLLMPASEDIERRKRILAAFKPPLSDFMARSTSLVCLPWITSWFTLCEVTHRNMLNWHHADTFGPD